MYPYPNISEKDPDKIMKYVYRLVEKMNEQEKLLQKEIDEQGKKIAELEGRI